MSSTQLVNEYINKQNGRYKILWSSKLTNSILNKYIYITATLIAIF